jgi:hypothetical protein
MHVTIQNFAFSPQTITVPPGTTVIWTNKDSMAHTVTSDTGAWRDSGNLATDQTFSHAFTKAGNYLYHCAIHPSMMAKVIVASGGTTGGSITGGGMGSMGPMLYPAVARGVHDVEEPRQGGRAGPGRPDQGPGEEGPAHAQEDQDGGQLRHHRGADGEHGSSGSSSGDHQHGSGR